MGFLFQYASAAGFLSHVLLSHRFLSSCAISSARRKLKHLSYRVRARALAEAKIALTDYFHATRGVPFGIADHIVSNSPISLSTLVSQAPLHNAIPPDFRRIIGSFLAYNPVNELDFFFESIGISPSHRSLSYSNQLFLSDDPQLLASVSPLLQFGFPWSLLGSLYLDSPSIFASPPGHLLDRLRWFEALGFSRVCVIAICLTFPFSLLSSAEDAAETERLFRDLKIVFLDYGLEGCAGDDLQVLLRFCRRIRLFYDMGSEKGAMGDLMGRSRRIFVKFEESVITRRLNFFLNLGMQREDIGSFILKNSEIFDFSLEDSEIVIPDYLIRVGLSNSKAASLMKWCPFVKGKNRLVNLPGVTRALDIGKWFLTKIVDEKNIHFLSPSFACSDSCKCESESAFIQSLKELKIVKINNFIDVKVEFFLSIGFAKNIVTCKTLGHIHGTKEMLHGRFDCLLGMGIKYDMLCRMLIASPKVFNQSADILCQKVNYLCKNLSYPIEYLAKFPAFLSFDLENRIKPRYNIINWLRENGFVKKHYAPATILANSEKRFILILSCIHPAAPKQWLECFSSHIDHNDDKKTY